MNTVGTILLLTVMASGSSDAETQPQGSSEASSPKQAAPAAEGLRGILPASAPALLAGLELLQKEVAAASETADWRADVATAQTDLERLYQATGAESAEPLSADAQNELLEKLRATQLRIRDAAGEIQGNLAAELREFRYRLWRRRRLLEASFEAIQGRSEALNEKIEQDRRQLSERLTALKQTLRGSPNGEGWIRYLGLETIDSLLTASETSSTSDEVAVLADRFDPSKVASAQRQALERPAFSAVWQSLLDYATDLQGLDPALAEQMHDDLGELWQALERYENEQSPGNAAQLRELGRSLASLGLAGQGVAEVLLDAYEQPNLWLAVSRVLASRYLPGPQRDRGPVRMQRGGTYVSGEQETRATPRLRFHNASPAAFSFELPGTVDTDIVASQARADITATIRSTFLASRRIEVTGEGLQAGRTSIDVRANSYVRDANVRGTLFPGIANRRAAEIGQQALNRSEPETEQRIAREVLDRFNPEVDRFVEKANARIDELRERHGNDDEAVEIETRSTEHWVLVDGTLAGPRQLAAWSPRLGTPLGTLAGVSIHETAVNHVLSRSDLSGKTYTREELREKLREAIASVADLQEEDTQATDEQPLKITFAVEDPARATLRDGTIELVLRATALEGASFQVGPHRIRVRYQPLFDEENLRLVRVGEIELGPLDPSVADDTDPESLTALRGVLEEVFPAESLRPRRFDASLGEENKKIELRILTIEVQDGWLSVSVGD